jgi:hypothetical protein
MKEVYRVDSKETGKMLFIAGCGDAKEDWSLQSGLLKKGIHPIFKLQKHFDKFGEDDMAFNVVKKVKDEAEMRKVILKAKEEVIEMPEEEPLPDFPIESEVEEMPVDEMEVPTLSAEPVIKEQPRRRGRKKR